MDIHQKLKTHKRLSILVLILGILLLIFMITVEDEPGAIPLFLIAAGVTWYVITKRRSRNQQV